MVGNQLITILSNMLANWYIRMVKSDKTNRYLNIGTLIFVFLVLIIAFFIKEQTIIYDLTGNADMTYELKPGESIMQTYSPNRRAITGIRYSLSEETTVSGDYTIFISLEEEENKEVIYTVTNSYNGEMKQYLEFTLPDKFYPSIGKRLNIVLVSDSSNLETVSLAADSSYRSLYTIDNSGNYKLGNGTLCIGIISQKFHKWFMLLCVLLYTYGLSFLLMHFLKTEFGETILLALICASLISYLFGFFGGLSWAPYFLMILSFVGIILFGIENINKVAIYQKLRFEHFLWLLLVIFLFVVIRWDYIGDPDSIFYINRCKYMFWTDSLAISSGYAFLLPVLGYLMEHLNGIFSEEIFLLAIMLYEFSIIFSFIGKLKAPKNEFFGGLFKILLLALGIILTIGIHPDVFLTSMMDVPFALTIAYIIFAIYKEKECISTWIQIVMASLALVMIKRAGIPVVLIIVCILGIQAFRYRGGRIFNLVYIKGAAFLLLISIVISKVIDIYTDNSQMLVKEDESPAFLADVLNTSVNGGISHGFDPVVIRKLIEAFLSTPVYYGMSYGEAMGILFVIAAIIWLYKKDNIATGYFVNSLEILLATGMYYAVISYKYLFAIEEGNQYTLNAYDRYAIHFIGAAAIYVIFDGLRVLLEENPNKHSDMRKIVTVASVVILMAVRTDFYSVTELANVDVIFIEDADDDLERVLTLYNGYGHKVYTYMAPDTFAENGYYGKNLRMNSWPVYTIGNNTIIPSEKTTEFMDYISENAEYFYLVNYDDTFLNDYEFFFEKGREDIRRHAFYHIDQTSDGEVILEYLGQTVLNDYILKIQN